MCNSGESKIELQYAVSQGGILISLKAADKVYYQSLVSTYETMNWAGCIPNGEYQLMSFSEKPVQVSYTLKVNEKIIRNYENMKSINSQNYQFSLPIVPKVIFSYLDTVTYINQYISIQPIHLGTEICEEYSLSDTSVLPGSFSLDKLTGKISGTPTNPSKIMVYVNCLVLFEVVSVSSCTISTRSCPRNSVPFSVIINSGSQGNEKIRVSLKDDKEMEQFMVNGMLPSKEIFYSYCYSPNGYALALSSSDGVWPTDSTVKTIINGIQMTHSTIITETNSIPSNNIEIWKYSNVYVENWYRIETSWQEYLIDNFPARTESVKTYYFKRNFYFSGDKDMMYYVLNIKHDGGIVIYVNGEIVHRYKVANGWGPNTAPLDNDGFDGPARFLTFNLKNGLNTISAEVHTNNQGSEVFSITISYIKDISQCNVVSSLNMAMYFDNPGEETATNYMNIIDGNILNKYTATAATNKLGFFFNRFTSYPANRLDYFVPIGCAGRDWLSVKLGSAYYNRAISGTNLSPFVSPYIDYTEMYKTFNFDIPYSVLTNSDRADPYFMYSTDFSNKQSVQAIYFDVVSRGGECSPSTHSAEIRLLACKPSYCLPTLEVQKFGYEGTIEENKCLNSDDVIKYQCNKNGKWISISDESICSKRNKVIYRINGYLYKYGSCTEFRDIGRSVNDSSQ